MPARYAFVQCNDACTRGWSEGAFFDYLILFVRNDPLDQSRQFVATDILSHPRGGEGWDFVAVRVMEIGSDLFCVLSLVFPLEFNIGSGALAHCTFGEVSGVQDS